MATRKIDFIPEKNNIQFWKIPPAKIKYNSIKRLNHLLIYLSYKDDFLPFSTPVRTGGVISSPCVRYQFNFDFCLNIVWTEVCGEWAAQMLYAGGSQEKMEGSSVSRDTFPNNHLTSHTAYWQSVSVRTLCPLEKFSSWVAESLHQWTAVKPLTCQWSPDSEQALGWARGYKSNYATSCGAVCLAGHLAGHSVLPLAWFVHFTSLTNHLRPPLSLILLYHFFSLSILV